MSATGPRQVVFVCAGILDTKLVSKIIIANTPAEATKLFTDQYSFSPQDVLGPFFRKRAQVLEETVVLKFSNQNKKAIYNDWLVTAFLLQEPADHAYLVFIKRVDDQKMSVPKGTITVPISDLRFI